MERGLAINPMEMARIGQFCLNKGIWKKKQRVLSKWIDESTKERSQLGDFEYRYLWWIIDSEDGKCYASIKICREGHFCI